MTRLPRLAVGTVQPGADELPMIWAFLSLLEQRELTVQTFSSQARFHPRTGVSSVTGQNQRHLDSWLMTRDMAREIFFQGSFGADVAVVEGAFGPCEWNQGPSEHGEHDPPDLDPPGADREGHLETLCDWLDLPRLAILDARRLTTCGLPEPPTALDGLLLDAAPEGREGTRMRIDLEARWGVPVLGTLPARSDLRTLVASLPTGCEPSRDLCGALGDALAATLDFPRLMGLAAQRAFPSTPLALFQSAPEAPDCTVAVAYDRAFHCYFPDALDLLECRGARIRDFSPLCSESIPDGTDVVYFGCGHISRFAEELAANCCLKQSLRAFAAAGGRIYAECAGLAYLCERVELESGDSFPMAGVFPAVARRNPRAGQPHPVDLPFARDCWLAPAADRLRGYANESWEIQPLRGLQRGARGRLVSHQQAVGSCVHLDFAAQPHLLDRFFYPLRSPSAAIR